MQTEVCRVTPHGRTLDAEMPGRSVDRAASGAGARLGRTDRLALVPHLESFADPVQGLKDSLSTARFAAIAYQSPSEFMPAVPILAARDLASVCALAGFQIRDFHTEAGLTRLIVERATDSRRPRTSEYAVVAEEADPVRPCARAGVSARRRGTT